MRSGPYRNGSAACRGTCARTPTVPTSETATSPSSVTRVAVRVRSPTVAVSVPSSPSGKRPERARAIRSRAPASPVHNTFRVKVRPVRRFGVGKSPCPSRAVRSPLTPYAAVPAAHVLDNPRALTVRRRELRVTEL